MQQLLCLHEGGWNLTHGRSQLPSAPHYIQGRPCCLGWAGMACMAVAAFPQKAFLEQAGLHAARGDLTLIA